MHRAAVSAVVEIQLNGLRELWPMVRTTAVVVVVALCVADWGYVMWDSPWTLHDP